MAEWPLNFELCLRQQRTQALSTAAPLMRMPGKRRKGMLHWGISAVVRAAAGSDTWTSNCHQLWLHGRHSKKYRQDAKISQPSGNAGCQLTARHQKEEDRSIPKTSQECIQCPCCRKECSRACEASRCDCENVGPAAVIAT